jgi:hypothetical protein
MPRSAATIFGIALAAFSIGFNTARYPVVWEMVGPATADATPASLATVSQMARPEAPEPPPSPTYAAASEPAKPIDVKPAAETAGKGAGDLVAAAKPDASAAANADASAIRSLIPVRPISIGSGPIDGVVIRRLPLVGQNPNDGPSQPVGPSNGSVPIYPTTGIE